MRSRRSPSVDDLAVADAPNRPPFKGNHRGVKRGDVDEPPMIRWLISACFVFALGGIGVGAPQVAPGAADKPEKITLRDFAPGVRIDWKYLTVEIDSEVVLREGPLELLACSPQTREHESILVVKAKPLNILRAMGLIGLEPGSPVRYDEKTDRWSPASGESLDLRVRCEGAPPGEPVSATSWLADTKSGKPPARIDWIFAGSRAVAGGRFGADLEGTVACVVDFDTALISPATQHSADNEELWLKANTEAIPPRGTHCTLLVRSAYRPTVEVELAADAALRLGEKSVTPAELATMLRGPSDDIRPARLTLRLAPQVTDEAAAATRERIVRAGFDGVIEIRRSGRPQDHKRVPDGPSKDRD